MIVVRVELWSAVDGRVTELARMAISNDGKGPDAACDYDGVTFKGRSAEALSKAMVRGTADVARRGRATGHRRHDLHVWHLVGKMLAAMGYVGPAR